jgi:hypothetical protein
MSKLDEFRAQNPAYKDVDDDTLADALYKKFYSTMPRSDYNAKIGYTPKNAGASADKHSLEGDIAHQFAQHANEALNATYYLPNRIVNAGAQALGYAPPLATPDLAAIPSSVVNAGAAALGHEPVMSAPQYEEAQTPAGKWAGAIGEQVGAAVLPGVALTRAGYLTAELPTLYSTLGSAIGAGVATQGARDLGFGPYGQFFAGLAGGFASPAVGQGARAVGRGVGLGARTAVQAVEDNSSAAAMRAAAERKATERMMAGGVTPAQARDAIMPEISTPLQKRGFTPEIMADIVGRRIAGEPAADIAADYAHLTDDNGRALSADTVNKYAGNYRKSNPTPLDITDLTAQLAGEGNAAPIRRFSRAGLSLTEEGGAERQRLLDRQLDQSGRTTGILGQAAPGQDYEAVLEPLAKAAKAERKKIYDDLYFQPAVIADAPRFARLFAQPQARKAWESAQQLAWKENEPLPNWDEATKIYGVRGKASLGLDENGNPTVPEQYPASGGASTKSPVAGATEEAGTSPFWAGGAADRTQGVIGFLRAKGGIRPSGETRAMNAERTPGLINRNGMTHDQAREALVEAGYMHEDPLAEATTSVSDFHDLLDRAVRGEKIVRAGDVSEQVVGAQYRGQRNDAAALEQLARDHLREIGMPEAAFNKLSTAERMAIAQKVASGQSSARAEELARMHFPEGVFDKLPPADRAELAARIEAGEDPHNVFEELAIRGENAGSTSGQTARSEPARAFTIPARAIDYFQRALKHSADDGFKPGGDSAAGSVAKDLRDELLDILDPAEPVSGQGRAMPGYRAALNDVRLSYGPQEALEAGANMVARLGSEQAQQQLAVFDKMTPVQQKLFRIGLMRRAMLTVGEKQFTADAVSQFNTPNTHAMLRRIFPEKELPGVADTLIRQLRGEAITTRGKNFRLGGSITAEKTGDMERATEPLGVAADAISGRWERLRDWGTAKLRYQLGQQSGAHVADVTTANNPAELLPMLNRMQQYAEGISSRNPAPASATARTPQYNLPGERGVNQGANGLHTAPSGQEAGANYLSRFTSPAPQSAGMWATLSNAAKDPNTLMRYGTQGVVSTENRPRSVRETISQAKPGAKVRFDRDTGTLVIGNQ